MEVRRRAFGGSPLVRGWMAGDPAALAFYPSPPPSTSHFHRQAQVVAGSFPEEGRVRVAQILGGEGLSDDPRLRSFVENQGFALTTGQQPGIFGGPLYALYKGLTAARLARRLERELGRPILPIFWVASEDHDWEEVRVLKVVDPTNELREIALPSRDDLDHPPLFRISMGEEEMGARVSALLEALPVSDFSPRWAQVVEEVHGTAHTLPEAFEAILRTLMASEGVYFVQAHHPTLKEVSLPLLVAELEGAMERDSALQARGEALVAAGYDLQVPFLEGGTNLFLEGPTGRERLFRDGAGFRLRRSGTHTSLAEIRERVAGDPSILSPNVLLRPVVEAAVFPTLGYVAGPGEAAYLAQVAPVFEGHGIPQPLVVPRFSGEVVERKVGKVLEKFSLDSGALARPFHEVAGDLAREEVPPEVREALGELRRSVGKGAGDLQRAVTGVDPTLKGPVEHLRNQTFSLLDEMEKKVVQSLKRENEVALAQVEKARLHLFPGGIPQERVFSPFYYLFRYGDEFLEAVVRAVDEGVAG